MTPDMEVPTRAGGLQNQPLFRAFAHRIKGSRGGGRMGSFIKAPNLSAPSVLDLQDDRLRGFLRAIPHPSCDNLATKESLKSAKVLQTPRRTFFSICKTRDAVSVISKISRLRSGYCPKRSKFQSTQSAYRGHRFIGGAQNFPLRFSVKNHFGVLPKHQGLECAQRHVSVKVHFGRLPKQGSLRWDSLKNSRPYPKYPTPFPKSYLVFPKSNSTEKLPPLMAAAQCRETLL